MPDIPESAEANGIENEMIRLYEEYAAVLIRYAFGFTKDKDLARDAVQICFFRYFLHRKAGYEVQNRKAWLIRVVRNYALDRLRETNSRGEVPISEVVQSAALTADASSAYEQADILRHIPRLLTPRELACVQLRQKGLSYEEIGDTLKISQGTVGALLTRALKKLRSALGWL